MDDVRKRALWAVLIEFVAFSVAGSVMMMALFHLAVLAIPFIAFMWTFWGFNLFSLVFGIKVKQRYKLSFATLNFIIISMFYVVFVNEKIESKIPQFIIILCFAVLIIAYLVIVVQFIKNHIHPVINEVKKLFHQKNEEE